MKAKQQAVPPNFKDILLTRHDATDTICVSGYKMQNGKFVVSERFCNGVDEAANLIERSYQREDIGAIWTNIQKLKPGSHRRKKGETIEAYTNILIDIDRRVKKDADGNKVNATDEERAVLQDVAQKVSAFLREWFGQAVLADSGNGFHVSWRCEPMQPPEGQQHYRELLTLLRAKFEQSDLNMEIDLSLADDTQVVTVWGTWNRKYVDMLERPTRQSKMLLKPSTITPIKTIDILLCLEVNRDVLKNSLPEGKKFLPGNKNTDNLKANPKWLEEFGVMDLIEHWEGFIVEEEGGAFDKSDGTYYPIKPCPCHKEEDLHEHSNPNDCCLVEYNDGGIGIACFSRDFGLKTVINKMNRLVGENYPHLVYYEETDKEVADAFGVMDVAAVITPVGMVIPEHEKPKELFEKPGIELWKMPEDAMYGWLGEQTLALNAPLSLAYPTMLCFFAGQGVSKSGSVRGNLYGCLIGGKGTGKTRTMDRAKARLSYEFPFQIKKGYPGSEHGLMIMLGGKKPKDMEALDWSMTKPFLLVQDEFRNTFAKAGIDNSALPFAFNHLFNQSDYETASQKGAMVCIAQLSIIGGLTADNGEQFAEVFGKATTTGVYDRFIYGVAPPSWDWDDTWEKTSEQLERRPGMVNISNEIYAMKKAWQAEEPESRRRLGELALRVALVSASANGDVTVTVECMAAALKFCEWQQQIRAWYKPSEQDDKDGLCQEAIERVLERLGKQDRDGWVWMTDAKRKGNLSRHGASRAVRILKGMVEYGMVEEEKDATDDEGLPTKGAKAKTGRIRLVR